MDAKLKEIPEVRRAPVIGRVRVYLDDRLTMLTRFAAQAGDLGRMTVGSRTFVLANSPELIHAVLVTHVDGFHKGPSLSVFARPVLGNGLLTSEGDFHRRQRKLVAPAFQPARITGYAGTMAAYAEDALNTWPDGGEVNVAHEMMRLTLRIVGKTLFDTDVLGEAEELGDALTVAMRYAVDQLRSPIHIPLEWNTPGNRRVRWAIERLDSTIYRLIEERRASGEDKGDLLSMLLLARDAEDGKEMPAQQVRDEAMTLFLAGHETTANAMAWTWYLLSQHPEAYTRVREEVDTVLQGRTPAYEDLPRLPYCLQVFKESMRLYPPAYILTRQAIEDVDLRGHLVPKGAIVMLSPWLMHRKPEFFPDPLRFDPERFTPEAEKRIPRYAYMPFGGGARICIGAAFALMEGHLLTATIAQRVAFQLTQRRVRPEPLITLRPRGGIRMAVRRRWGTTLQMAVPSLRKAA